MLYVFGDIHLSSMNPWNNVVGEKFIEWFKIFAEDVSKKDADANILWLGDITEKDVNPGDVIDQEYRIFDICSKNFNNVYVLMGNHDLKLYKQKAQHSLKFLRNIPKVVIIDKPTTFTINNTKIRALPHIRVEGQSLSDYYSNMRFNEDVDLTVGHWNKIDPKHPNYGGVDVSNMRTKMLCLGHIHTRIEDCYTGSIFANKYNEAGERVYKMFDNGKEVGSAKLPNFLDYRTIEYPNEPDTSADYYTTVVYDVEGVKSVQQAKIHYPNIYIRGTVKTKIDRETISSIKSSDVFLYHNNIQAYNDWLTETKWPVSRQASVIINDILK